MCSELSSRCKLSHSLGAFRHSVLGKLARQDETDCSLNFPRCDSGFLVVAGQRSGLNCDLLEDVSDEGVQDGHGLGGDSSVGVNLLQDLYKHHFD